MIGGPEHILRIENLGVSYGSARAVRDFTIDVTAGEIVGLVGESGSGKSTVLRSVAGLLGRSGKVDCGCIVFRGRELTGLRPREMAALRGGEIAYVFQDPTASLDPLKRVGKQFDECIAVHRVASGEAVRALECSLLAEMGFDDPERVLSSWPHELSGGMCQRVVLAMSAALDPVLMLADEPTSALDVAVQQQVSRLLLRLRDERGMAIVVVSHNIAAIAQIADRIGVMLDGKLVEMGARDEVLRRPAHPYTKALIAAVPRADGSLPGLPDYEVVDDASRG